MAEEIGPPEIITGFLKNDREMIAGYVSAFKGKVFVHVRTFVPSAAEEGEWIRTQKGVAIPVEHFHAVKDLVGKLWDMSGENIAGQVPRTHTEIIRVGLSRFKGSYFCDVRTFYDADGEWKPSPKGISVRTERLQDLDELFEALSNAIEQP